MTNDQATYDAIVVGARCAGSPTGMLLARQGHRVLVVDRATFPSDTVSTHLLHPPAVASLSRWGLLDNVLSTGCPAIERYSFDFGAVTISGTPRPAVDGWTRAYAPRRTVLDTVLVDAAVEAGAEVRQSFTVDEILVDGGRVSGIRGRDADGTLVVERSHVVVGADGAQSMVADAVRSREYHGQPVLQWGAYTYWRDLPVSGMEVFVRPNRGFAALPTNDELTLVLVGCPAEQATAFRSDIEGNYLASLEMVPDLAERMHNANRVERFHIGGVPNRFRTPYGYGWMLVGDAGYVKDPITAQGIADAFADAECAAAALHHFFDGTHSFDDVMATFHADRDRRALPIYELTTRLASLEPPPPELQQILAAIAGNEVGMNAFVSVIAGTMSPGEFFDPTNVARLTRVSAA